MSGRDAYFAYMRDFNEREGINSFYGRDKKRFLAGWHGVADKDRPDKLRNDVKEPPRLAPRPPTTPIPESLRVATERARDIMENKQKIRSKLIKIADDASKLTNNKEFENLRIKFNKYRAQAKLYGDAFRMETKPLISKAFDAFEAYVNKAR